MVTAVSRSSNTIQDVAVLGGGVGGGGRGGSSACTGSGSGSHPLLICFGVWRIIDFLFVL